MDVGSKCPLLAALVAVGLLTVAIGGLSVTTQTPAASGPADTDGTNGSAPGVAALHEAGVTGENVSVGVVDVTGFDPSRAGVADEVVDARAFASGESIDNNGRDGHGTAAASLVDAVAPDADLYLATFDTHDEYVAAVRWLVSEDVDVVVAPVSFYGTPGDGSARVARITDEAARSGTVVVAPTGNLAQGHWNGQYDGVREGKLRFAGGTRNFLSGESGDDLTLWLSWPGNRSREDYTAEVYWTNGTATRLVARSRPYETDDVPNERIVADLGNGSHFVVVRGPEEPTGTRLELSSPTHALQYRTPNGSVVAPATGRRVLAVGAYDHRTGAPAAFSSRGPTTDGRTGVDVLAPDRYEVVERPSGFVGSSAAATYVAGVAALVHAENDRLTALQVRRIVTASATDLGSPGPDPIAGHGRVNASRAVAMARNGTS